MLYVAICNDKTAVTQKIKELLLEVGVKLVEQIRIDIYLKGEELEKRLKRGMDYNLIFLDIELGENGGTQLGKKIRDELQDEITQIVYISSSESYGMELFETRPLYFLMQPLQKEKLEVLVKKTCELMTKGNQVIAYQKDQVMHLEYLKNILYLKSELYQVKMITVEGEKKFNGSLKHFKFILEKCGFFPIHNSVWVNYKYVRSISYHKVLMLNGIELDISQSKRKEVRETQMKFRKGGIFYVNSL